MTVVAQGIVQGGRSSTRSRHSGTQAKPADPESRSSLSINFGIPGSGLSAGPGMTVVAQGIVNTIN
jgi:hypothetical protein